ncbi:phasin family protein [Marilutibacter alkalisoli]|uniref:Poly(Hydroxyalcanoate) granule associated protein n=1 Tax=Marilutibacter alkalisoli TaxID=2591633 RepID=A0A514BRX3_9GAMM|nr:phasin family protein [Lysobacter alkalisoli]QDH70133.1 poly(hydroxyalcanoate) granule associated protein [Lysobacter alkalisoli]
MTSAKKTTRGKSARKGAPEVQAFEDRTFEEQHFEEQAERLAKSISESAQQIWLAGLGAFARAQAEGTRLFEGLVKEGQGLEQSARKLADGQTEAMREAVESRVAQAREQTSHAWGRLEKAFEGRVQQALSRLGVPGQEDLAELSRRIDALADQLPGYRTAGASRKATAKKPAMKKPAVRKPAVRKAVASKPVTKKPAVKKTGAKQTVRRARPS